jgi:hypothetical protein
MAIHGKTVYLYDEPDAPGLDTAVIGGYLASELPGLDVQLRRDFLTHQLARFPDEQREVLEREMMKQLGRARVTNLAAPCEREHLPVSPEELGLDRVYDAAALQAILRLLIAEEESSADHIHLVFTEHAIGSWSGETEPFRLHILCMGEPSVLSTTGLVEALPRPREYEFRRAQLAFLGLDEDALEDLAEEFADRTFGYGDRRINQVCQGYALMACYYRLFGEAFCHDPACRLYAARSHEELIEVQCGERVGLCERHDIMRQVLVEM